MNLRLTPLIDMRGLQRWVALPDLGEDIYCDGYYCNDFPGSLSMLLIFLMDEEIAIMINFDELNFNLYYEDRWMNAGEITYESGYFEFEDFPELQELLNDYIDNFFIIEELY